MWGTSCFGLYRLFVGVAGSRSIVCGAFSGFCSLPPHPLLSTVYQCDGCPFFSGAWGLMAGLSGLPAIGAVSILELAANSGSSRMFRAPNLQRATMLFTITSYQVNYPAAKYQVSSHLHPSFSHSLKIQSLKFQILFELNVISS